MKLFGMVLVGLAKAEADYEVVSCNNENTRAPEMIIKVRDIIIDSPAISILMTVVEDSLCR